MKRPMLIAVVLSLGTVAWAKAPLLPLHCYRFTELDENGGIKAVPNSGTGTSQLTQKLYGSETSVPVLIDGEGQPMLGKFGTYSIYQDSWAGKTSSYWMEGDETTGLGCSSATGFAISFWFFPKDRQEDWKDFFTFRMGAYDYNFEYSASDEFMVLDFSCGGDEAKRVRDRHNASALATVKVKPNDWNHFCLVWKPYASWRDWKHYGEVWVNGQRVGIFLPNSEEVSNDNSVLRTLYLGAWQKRYGDDAFNPSRTGIGEVAVYGSPISDDDVAYLYTHAPGPLPRGREMTVGLHFDRSWANGDGDSPTALANSGTLQIPFTIRGNGTLATESSGACNSGFGLRINSDTWCGDWLQGDATTGLGASKGTGITFSYWTRTNSQVGNWSDLFSIGFDDTVDFWHEFPDSTSYAFYGDCSMNGFEASESIDTWHHHVLVLEPGSDSFQHWQDGVKNGTVSFNDQVTDGLFRRLCIGPAILNQDGQVVDSKAASQAGLDEVGIFNYAMSEEEIAWLGTHEAALPPLAVTSLARTVSADGNWAGASAEWTLNDTDRKIVYPAGEDTQAGAVVTVNGTPALTVDTLVAATNVEFVGAGAVTLSVASGCSFAPAALSVGSGVTVNLPTGAFAGTVRGSGTLSGLTALKGTWEIAELDSQTRGYLSWPADVDFSEATINVTAEIARFGEYTLVEDFTGELPGKVLHNGVEDNVFRVMVSGGNLVLKNRSAMGMMIIFF